jgi:hypothetical protein
MWQVWRRKEMHLEFWWGNLQTRDHYEDAVVDGGTILTLMLNNHGVDWIHLAPGRDKWWALVNMVMNNQVPQNVGNSFSKQGTVSFSRRPLL